MHRNPSKTNLDQKPRHWSASRLARTALVGLFIVTMALLAVSPWGPSSLAETQDRLIVVFENPPERLLDRIQGDRRIDVRWVEAGLVVAEIDPRDEAVWGGRLVGRRSPQRRLGILRADDLRQAIKQNHQGALQFIEDSRIGTASAIAGEVTLLVATPASWPTELLGCHGGLVLARHDVDPRTLLQRGPPEALAPWVLGPIRPWTEAQRQALAAVSTDTLQAYWDALRKNELGLPADRWAFGVDYNAVYVPQVQSLMQRLVQGINNASVEVQPFPMDRQAPGAPPPPDSTVTIISNNVIARIPGSVPGTGTFVICAHLDATGSRGASWVSATNQGIPIETPGAEDNASGVACVLEMLRNVSDGVRAGNIDFAFDVEFIAFGGEEGGGLESGLVGSGHYVAQRIAAGTKLLGVFNLDMVGSDSLGNNLQIVHNVASTWMVDFITEAMEQVVPPLNLTLTPDLNEALASDHNSFWSVGSDGVLGAGAPVSILRTYASYHRPADTGADVQVSKMTEVTRAFQAALLRFDLNASTDPGIIFPPEKLQLLFEVQGTEFSYAPGFHVLNPGETRLKSMLSVYNQGATYNGDLRFVFETQIGTVNTVVLDSTQSVSMSTGARFEMRLDPVPLEFGGPHTLEVRVTHQDTGGSDVVQSATIDYIVEGAGPPNQKVVARIAPNPVANLTEALVQATTSEDGDVAMQVYNLEGELISSWQDRVTAAKMASGVSLLDPGKAPRVVSGTYLAHVRWTGLSGSGFSEVLRVVVRK